MELQGSEVLGGLLRDHLDPLLQKYHEDLVQRFLSLESVVSDVADKMNTSKDQGNCNLLLSAWANDSDQNGFQQQMDEATSKPLPTEKNNDFDDSDWEIQECSQPDLAEATDSPLPSEEDEDAVVFKCPHSHHLCTTVYLNRVATQQELTRGISVIPQVLLTRMQWFVTCPSFDLAIICLIVSNGLLIGVQAQFFATTSQEDMPLVVRLVAWGYCLIFFIELVLRMCAFGCAFFYNGSRGWNIADFLIVTLSIAEVILLNIGGHQGAGQLSMVRLVRIVRVLRIVRFAFFRELRVLVVAIAGALKSLMWALVLLCFIMYVVAIVLTFGAAEEAKNDEVLERHWSTLFKSMYTLWMSVTGGISWIEVSEPLGQAGDVYRFAFNGFIGFVQIAVLNVVTGVFCENAIQSASRDEHEVMLEHVRRKAEYVHKLNGVFGHCDGEISVRDFEAQMETEEMKLYFETLDVHVGNVRTLFRLLDKDGSGLISIDELVTGCIDLRGSAKAVDVAEVFQFLGHLQTDVSKNRSAMSGVDEKLTQLGAVLLSLKADVRARPSPMGINGATVQEKPLPTGESGVQPPTPQTPLASPRSDTQYARTPMTTPHSPRLDIGLRSAMREVVGADEPVEPFF